MPNIVKKATGPILTSGANWVGENIPGTTDIAEWQATPILSLGPSLTGNLNVGGTGGGILISGASADITHSGGTITIGTGGFTQPAGNNKRFRTTGTISVNGNQTWSLANPTGISGLYFTGFTGTGNISVVNSNPASTGWGDAYFVKTGGTSTYSGTISLKDKTGVTFDSATGRFSVNTTISVDGEYCLISGTADNVIYIFNNAGIVVNSDFCSFGNGTARTIAAQCPVTFNGYRKFYSTENLSCSGTFTATSGFEFLGPTAGKGVHIWGSANIGGTVKVVIGRIVLGSDVGSTIAPNQFNNTSVIDLGTSTNSSLQFMGGTNSATVTAQLVGAGMIFINSTGGITFNNATSTFTGSIEVAAGSGFVNPRVIFASVPPPAVNIALTVWSSVTATTSVSPWVTFQAANTTVTSSILLLSQEALTGTQNAYIIEVNGDNTTFTKNISQRTDSSPQAALIPIFLTGTGNNTVLEGNILPTAATGTVGLTKNGTGKWVLAGTGSSNYNGPISLNSGTLTLQGPNVFGSTTAGAFTQTAGTLELNYSPGISITKTGLAFTLASTSGADSIRVLQGTNTIACGTVTLSNTTTINVSSGASLRWNNTGVMQGATSGLTKVGTGTLDMGTQSNSFGGAVTISAGTLVARVIANTSSNSSLGTGGATGASAITLAGTLRYEGTVSGRTNRSITFTGAAPSLDASGATSAATVTYDNCSQSLSGGDRTITFTGSNTGNNTLAGSLIDYLGTTSVTKTGAGRWVLSAVGGLTYDGPTTISAGTLNLGDAAAGARTLVGNVAISGGTLEHLNSTVTTSVTMTGGTIRTRLTGANTVTATSGSSTLYPQQGNSHSSGTTVASGAVLRLMTDATDFVSAWTDSSTHTGTGTATVNGAIHTAASVASQRGRAKYANVVFNSGSSLHIGAA